MRKKKKKGKNTLSVPMKKGNVLKRFIDKGRRKLTIMFIPHSEERVVNIQISLFSLVFSGMIVLGLLISFFWFTTSFSENRQQLMASKRNLEDSVASLEVVRDEIDSLGQVASRFNETLSKTMTSLGIDNVPAESLARSKGDLSSFFDIIESSAISNNNEIGDLKQLNASLQNAIKPLNEIVDALNLKSELLTDIPTIWPLKGVDGHVTNPYGPAIDPFGDQPYLHKGLDIGYGRGVPILATANGKVVKRAFGNRGYGNHVIIQHNFGFSTLYGHMQNIRVKEGQIVKQGDIIGTMGNTGNVTGVHLHLEVRIGTQVVDPAKYISLQHDPYENIKYNLQEYK